MVRGYTSDGTLFEVPKTPDMIETFLAPSRWGIAESIAFFIIFLNVLSILFSSPLPLPIYISWFIFWRLSYNIGLAYLLFIQGRKHSLTRFVEQAPKSRRCLLNWVATYSLPDRHDWASAPHQLNAWLTFRSLAFIVLAADGTSYIALAFACFQKPSSLFVAVPCFTLGILLSIFSVWTKKEAHNALGDYAWFWGDFFFMLENSSLVLDGVFSLAPHPMYTLGYTAYYGAAIITRSPLLLFVSLFAHVSQMAFLFGVEQPHMERIYGGSSKAGPPVARKTSSNEITPTRHRSSSSGCGQFSAKLLHGLRGLGINIPDIPESKLHTADIAESMKTE